MCVPNRLFRLPLTHTAVEPRSWGVVCVPTSCFLNGHVAHFHCVPVTLTHPCKEFSRHFSFSPKSFAVSFQWPILRTLTTQQRSLSFTAINVGSHARAKCFGSRPSISTSNASPAKVQYLQHPAKRRVAISTVL